MVDDKYLFVLGIIGQKIDTKVGLRIFISRWFSFFHSLFIAIIGYPLSHISRSITFAIDSCVFIFASSPYRPAGEGL